MYQEWGGAPAAGTLTGLGRVAGRLVMIIANDATVKAGAFFPLTAKKVIRAQNIAIENRIPTIYLVDSAGIFLPLQEDVFPDTDDFGRVFRNNAVMSAMGIPQITAIMGMCVAGGAYLPVMCDHILMTEGSGLFLAGPALVQAAIGQRVSAEELGGAKMHAQISGTVDFREPDDDACLAAHSRPGGHDGPSAAGALRPRRSPSRPRIRPKRSTASSRPIPRSSTTCAKSSPRIVDGSRFEEYRAEYGQTVLCGYARIGGWAVGIVANQKMHVPTHGRRHRGAARRIRRRHLHRIGGEGRALHHGLQPEPGAADFPARRERLHGGQGSRVERHHSRRRQDGQRRGQQRGAEDHRDPAAAASAPDNYAMCGKAYDPRFIFAWPTARYAVMSGDSAAGTLVEIKVKQLEREGKKLSAKELERAARIRAGDLRAADRSAVCGRAPLGGRHHRSCADP